MITSTIPSYQAAPSTVSTSHQDVIVVSYDLLLRWISDVMVGIPMIGIAIVNVWSPPTLVIPSTSDINDSICWLTVSTVTSTCRIAVTTVSLSGLYCK